MAATTNITGLCTTHVYGEKSSFMCTIMLNNSKNHCAFQVHFCLIPTLRFLPF